MMTTTDSVLPDLDLDFDPTERASFLEEVAYVARHYRSSLGASSPEADALSQHLEALPQKLEGETAEFSPQLTPIPLPETYFADQGRAIPLTLAYLMQHHNFYLVHFPVTLMAKEGWVFKQLDCMVEFNPGQPPGERPTAYQIYPEDEWQDVIRAYQGLKVGLDERLEFKVDSASLEALLPSLDSAARAKIALKVVGAAGLLVGPFDYHIQRPKILSRGRGNVKVLWRLTGEKYYRNEESQLAVVLQVPKAVRQINAIGVLKASKGSHFLTDLLRFVLPYLTEGARKFIQDGAPIRHKMPWRNIIANV